MADDPEASARGARVISVWLVLLGIVVAVSGLVAPSASHIFIYVGLGAMVVGVLLRVAERGAK